MPTKGFRKKQKRQSAAVKEFRKKQEKQGADVVARRKARKEYVPQSQKNEPEYVPQSQREGRPVRIKAVQKETAAGGTSYKGGGKIRDMFTQQYD